MMYLISKSMKVRHFRYKGVGIAFIDYQISRDSKEMMLKICKDRLKVIFQWVWILFCYMLSQDQKYRSSVAGVHLLIQEQPLYDQSTSPCKSFL